MLGNNAISPGQYSDSPSQEHSLLLTGFNQRKEEKEKRGTVLCPTHRVVKWSNGNCPTFNFRGLKMSNTLVLRVGRRPTLQRIRNCNS